VVWQIPNTKNIFINLIGIGTQREKEYNCIGLAYENSELL